MTAARSPRMRSGEMAPRRRARARLPRPGPGVGCPAPAEPRRRRRRGLHAPDRGCPAAPGLSGRSGAVRAERAAAGRGAAGCLLIELPRSPMPVARAQALAADPAGLRAMLAPVLLAWRPAKQLPHLPAWCAICGPSGPTALFAADAGANLLGRLGAPPRRRADPRAGQRAQYALGEARRLDAAGAIAICRACSAAPTGWPTASLRSRTGSPTIWPGKAACRARASSRSTIQWSRPSLRRWPRQPVAHPWFLPGRRRWCWASAR